MRIVPLLLISLFVLGTASLANDQSLEELRQANALLQAELDLARADKPYLLIDLQIHQIQLKASGLALQSWGIDHFRRWGHPVALPAAILQSKSSLNAPERDIQVVKMTEPRGDSDSKPFKALELADMPTVYRMRLVNGTEISVRPTSPGRLGRLHDVYSIPLWYLSRPLISSWNFLRSSPYNELALSLSEQDARMLYWAFSESTPCLIRLPAAVVATVP